MWTREMELLFVHTWNTDSPSLSACLSRLQDRFPLHARNLNPGALARKKAKLIQQGTVFKDRPPRARKRPAKGVTLAPAPMEVPVEALFPDEGVLFTEAKNSQCRWIDGDPRDPNLRVCGCPTKPGSSYCDHHHSIVYVSPASSRRKDIYVTP